MPTKTLHYDMTMFGAGDAFLASQDRRRMTIIDNQFTIQTDLIGDGVIDGWTVTDQGVALELRDELQP